MKKLAVLLAALLVLSCGTTFLAAPSTGAGSPGAGSPGTASPGTKDPADDSTEESFPETKPTPEVKPEDKPSTDAPSTDAPSTDSTVVKVTGATAVDANGNAVKVDLKEVSEEVKAEAVKKAEELSKGSQILAIVDVVVPEGTGKVTVTFEVTGITKADAGKIFLLHQKHDGSWEVIHPSAVVDGKITATFNSLSPVAIVKIADTATTLPKTGAPVVLPVVALICAAGAAGCAKKVKFD